MGSHHKLRRHKPKELTSFAAAGEVKTFDSALKRGISNVNNVSNTNSVKKELLQDVEIKNKTMDYIFGKSDENPLAKTSKTYEDKKQALLDKEYKSIDIVSIK